MELQVHRTLEVIWYLCKDVFRIQCTNIDKPFTKRCILSVIGSIYDPIGVCTQVTLAGRLIQRLVLPVRDDILFGLGRYSSGSISGAMVKLEGFSLGIE